LIYFVFDIIYAGFVLVVSLIDRVFIAMLCIYCFVSTFLSMFAFFSRAGKGCSDPACFLWDLQKDLGLPTRLGAIGFKFDDIARAAQAVVDSLKEGKGYVNPRPVGMIKGLAVVVLSFALCMFCFLLFS
jgi:hypothetical protein